MGSLERMKHGNGIKDRDDKSRGIEILNDRSFRQNQHFGENVTLLVNESEVSTATGMNNIQLLFYY